MRGWFVVGILGLATLAAWTASAQPTPSPGFTIDGISANQTSIVPDVGSVGIEIAWTYSFNSPAYAAAGTAVGSGTLQWDMPECGSEGVFVSGALTESISFENGEQSVSGITHFEAGANHEAPGEQPIGCTFGGHVLANSPGVPESAPASANTTIRVQYLGIVVPWLESTNVEAGPEQPILFRGNVTSLGNSPSLLRFEAFQVEEGWSVDLPKDIVLGPGEGINITLAVNGPPGEFWTNRLSHLRVQVTPVSTVDGSEGEMVELPLHPRTRGLDPISPGGGVLVGIIFVGTITAVVVVRDQRRKSR